MSAYSDVLPAASQEAVDAIPRPEDIPVLVVGIRRLQRSKRARPWANMRTRCLFRDGRGRHHQALTHARTQAERYAYTYLGIHIYICANTSDLTTMIRSSSLQHSSHCRPHSLVPYHPRSFFQPSDYLVIFTA